MNRKTKKLVYGIFWNALLAAIILVVYLVFVRSSASCFDGVRNQNEQGVDCGGSCASCEAKNLLAIRTIRDVELFTTANGSVTLLAAVLNPNAGYVAEFPYEFALLDASGKVLERITGTDTLFASETRFLVTGAAETPAKKVAHAALAISTPQWTPKNEFLKPNISILPGAQTVIENGAVFVRGTLKNQSSLSAESVRVVAFLLDRSGSELFVGQALLSRLSGGNETSFVVQFPADASLVTRVDTDATRLTAVSR
jgi:hypothetical protein